MAEGLADRLSIKPTESYGLNIRSSGDGVDRLYFRANKMPTLPPVELDQIEAMGENLKSANIQIHEFGRVTVMIPGYQLIEVSDVQGGRIIISARAKAVVNGIEVDLRGVVLDAQITGGVPSGTSLGVNGFASDLSLLNKIPGFSGSTSPWMAPEPMSSGILTVVATLGGWRSAVAQGDNRTGIGSRLRNSPEILDKIEDVAERVTPRGSSSPQSWLS